MENDKKYYGQICQDAKITEAFYKLHHTLIDEIVAFCKEHNIEIDDVHISADGIRTSIQYGQWTPGTDSSMVMYCFDKEHPYQQNLSEVEPFLFSM